MALLLRHPSANLRELWCDEPDLVTFLAHALRVRLRAEWRGGDQPFVIEVIREAARVDLSQADPFLGADTAELAAFLVVRDLAERRALHNAAVQLHGAGLFGLDPRPLDSIVLELIGRSEEHT